MIDQRASSDRGERVEANGPDLALHDLIDADIRLPCTSLGLGRVADATADFSLEVDRLFVNPAMTLATPLVRGQLARIDVADDRLITKVDAEWWVVEGDADNWSAMIYDEMATVTPTGGISFRMPSDISGVGRLELRVQLAAAQLTCNGF